MKHFGKTLLISVALCALAGCSNFNSQPSSGAFFAPQSNIGEPVSNTIGTSENQAFANEQIEPEKISPKTGLPKIVYFKFNSYELTDNSKNIANKNAQYLIQNPSDKVMIAGNTDPRGSQEYNFHLGQRRADAVKSYLIKRGVSHNQICTVSYGELRPAATPSEFHGNWEKAYRLDRRAVLEYGKTCTN